MLGDIIFKVSVHFFKCNRYFFIRKKAIVTKLSRLQWQKIYYLILGWFVFRFLKKKLTINKARLHTNKISAL